MDVLRELLISYFSGGYLQLSDSIFGQKKPVPLIGQLKNPTMVPNKKGNLEASALYGSYMLLSEGCMAAL